MNDVSREMLAQRIRTAITTIRETKPAESCPAHAGIAMGIALLLEKEEIELRANPQEPQQITIAGVKIVGSGTLLALIGALYAIAKAHGLAP